jgi:hypothetical protein
MFDSEWYTRTLYIYAFCGNALLFIILLLAENSEARGTYLNLVRWIDASTRITYMRLENSSGLKA